MEHVNCVVKRFNIFVIEASFVQERRSRHVHNVALETVDQELFEDLRVGVDSVYHEAAKVFFQVDAGDITPPGVFGEKTLPFDLCTTAEAAWRCLAQSVHDEKCTFSFSSGNDWSELTHDKTVGESFGVEITVAENTADFRIKQVFRRYVESDRNVIAWRSYIDPATFRDQQIEGVRFQEKGSIVIRKLSELQPPGTEFTRLRIWHVITPEMRSSTKGPAGQFVQELTNFVLGGSSSASTVQMIENMLMEQSRSRSTSCTV
uniref:Uncharacterized protein n=1 Tax=Hyaloperonospora arabidopsidis (strain Emoy2) TaxID=559515 RepID=M4BVC7_HYAAE